MRFRSPGFRRFAFVWAAVQFAAAGLTSLAHARAEVTNVSVAHIEATTSESCPVVHPVDCGVCRHAGATQLPAAAAGAHVVAATGEVPAASERPAVGRLLDALPDGRAPPVA